MKLHSLIHFDRKHIVFHKIVILKKKQYAKKVMDTFILIELTSYFTYLYMIWHIYAPKQGF